MKWRDEFPILQQTIYGQPLAYLDNAATTQKPQSVIDEMMHFYCNDYANIHRGIYALSQRASHKYLQARETVAGFLNAPAIEEIIFTSGTTAAINLVAHGLEHCLIKKDDEIIISAMEHHSNLVPWQMVCQHTGAQLKVIDLDEQGNLNLEHFYQLLTPRTKLVAVTHISNVLGAINPVKKIIEAAHQFNIPVLIDGAQAVAHQKVDVQTLDCDFYAFSAHKMYGPTGTGVLYAKRKWLEQMPPYQTGGDMVETVSFEQTDFNKLPYKFEAGTPNIAGVIGLAAAINYLQKIGWAAIAQHEAELMQYASQQLASIEGLTIIGGLEKKAGVISFVMEQAHAHDIATILDRQGVAIRAGHHCAMPLMQKLNLTATARMSLALYNTIEDIKQLLAGLNQVNKIFGYHHA